MINLLGHECQRLEHSSGLSIPNLRIELIPFRYEVGIKTRSKIFSSCPQSPNSILDAKRVLKLMSWWDSLLSKLGSEIIHDHVEHGHASTPSTGTERLPTKLCIYFFS